MKPGKRYNLFAVQVEYNDWDTNGFVSSMFNQCVVFLNDVNANDIQMSKFKT